MKIAIPSGARSAVIGEKTLKALRGLCLPNDIYVFVAEAERPEYEAALRGLGVNLVRGAKGITEQRNAVTSYFDDGERVLCLDDDITGWVQKGKTKHRPLPDICEFARQAFSRAEAEKVGLWGIYPVNNPFYMKPVLRRGLWFCIGQTFGVVNDRSVRLTVAAKDDYEMTLRCYERDGMVHRYDGIAAETVMYAPGGIAACDISRHEMNDHATDVLLRDYPGLVVEKARSAGGYREIKLVRPK